MSTENRKAPETSIPDPRPETVQRGVDHFVRGLLCPGCGHPSAVRVPWCPRCRSDMTEKLFGPTGVVWSSTVVRIPLPNRKPPYTLAYVDLDGGPRVLAHVTPSDGRLAVGRSVRIASATTNGDVQVTPA